MISKKKKRPSIEDAAKDLSAYLGKAKWITTIGVGSGNIYLYVKGSPKCSDQWEGTFWYSYPIVVKRTGKVVPVVAKAK